MKMDIPAFMCGINPINTSKPRKIELAHAINVEEKCETIVVSMINSSGAQMNFELGMEDAKWLGRGLMDLKSFTKQEIEQHLKDNAAKETGARPSANDLAAAKELVERLERLTNSILGAKAA